MKTNRLQLTAGLLRNTLLVIAVFTLAQCRGPRGYDGLDGADGDVYTYSAIYDVYANDWSGDADDYRVFLEVPEITNDIYYNGAVLVYRLFETEPKTFNMLPYTYVDNALTISMDYDAYVGGIELIYKEVFEGTNDTFAPEGDMAFKILIIEGIPLATVKSMVDVKDYNAVTKAFKLNETQQRYNKVF
jgi:hypothetical protein